MKTGKLSPHLRRDANTKDQEKSLFFVRISIPGWLVFVLFSAVSNWLG